MKQIFQKIVLYCSLVVLGGCSFVKLNPEAKDVFIAPSTQALNSCADLGSTTVSVWSKAEKLQSPEKILEQLNVLARNEAVKIGGNSVAPNSKIINGQRSYRIYNCSNN